MIANPARCTLENKIRSVPKTVIVIDDDQDDLDFIKESINRIDNSILCLCFVYPEEALRVTTNELIFIPDYIICDINMPRMPGDVILEKFRAIPALQDTVIAMFSTSIPLALSQKLLQAGADFTLLKPTRIEDYISMLGNVLTARRVSNPVVPPATEPIVFQDLNTAALVNATSAIYIIDYRWNYLFANANAAKRVNGYNLVGKNITEVWRELPQYNFQPIYDVLKDYVNKRKVMELNQRSPLNRKQIRIVGKPYADCYLFDISENTDN